MSNKRAANQPALPVLIHSPDSLQLQVFSPNHNNISPDEDAVHHFNHKMDEVSNANTTFSHTRSHMHRQSNEHQEAETPAQQLFSKDHTYLASHSQIIIEDSQEDAVTGYTQNSASVKQMTGYNHAKRVSTGCNGSCHHQDRAHERAWSKQEIPSDLKNVTLNFADSMELVDHLQGELDPCQMTKNSGLGFGQLLRQSQRQ